MTRKSLYVFSTDAVIGLNTVYMSAMQLTLFLDIFSPKLVESGDTEPLDTDI